MPEFILFLIVFTVVTALSFFIIRLKNINKELIKAIDQAVIDIENFRGKFVLDEQVEREHLLSFLNETRDIAYKYIEDVHIALLEYKAEIEYDLDNPSDLSIPRLKKAFEKLQNIYPKDIPND